MSFNNDISDLIDLAIEENRSYRFDNSDEYKEIYNRVDDKSRIVDYIEEELGCPIEVVFKALKDGIYQKELYFPNVKNHLDAKYLRLNTWYNQLEWTDIWNGCNVYEFELKDYGKTWALTKEELESSGDLDE